MSHLKNQLEVHEGDLTKHFTANQNDAADNANAPTAANPFATIADLSGIDTDELVKVSSDDTNADYLLNKVTGTAGKIVLTEVNPAGDEDLNINIGADVFDKTTDDTDDITEGATNKFNIVQDLFETVTGDSGSTTADSPTDTLTVSGGSGISTAVAGDTVTITNDSPNVDQDLFETITADSGSTTADSPTDTLTISGGTGITTSITGDTLTINGSAGVAAEMAICQARRTTDYTMTAAFADVTLDTTDEESDSSVIEHSVVTDRIVLKETGNYLIGYFSNFDFESASSRDTKVEGRLRLNDTSVIPGTFSRKGDHYSGSGVIGEDPFLMGHAVISATANDFITLQMRFTDDVPDTLSGQDVSVFAVRLQGEKGDTGDTGAGANIIVQKDDVTVGTVTATLNFEGSGITSVVDDGGNKSTVTIDSGLNGQVILNDTITPGILGASQNDWNPTGLSTCNVIRASSSAAIDITGIVAQPAGTLILFINIGSQNIKLKNNDALSVAANRFLADADLTVKGNTSKWIWYDGTTSRWRHTQI